MTKAIVEFIRQNSFLKNIPIVRKFVEGQYENWENKDELVTDIQKISPPTSYDAVMYVRCGCNRDFIYTEFTDIPNHDVDCVCGQKVLVYGN